MKLAAHILHWETGRWEGEREGRIRDEGRRKKEEEIEEGGRRREEEKSIRLLSRFLAISNRNNQH